MYVWMKLLQCSYSELTVNGSIENLLGKQTQNNADPVSTYIYSYVQDTSLFNIEHCK